MTWEVHIHGFFKGISAKWREASTPILCSAPLCAEHTGTECVWNKHSGACGGLMDSGGAEVPGAIIVDCKCYWPSRQEVMT